jgi:NAD(P)-dependent dehydrogenase (short-subunit alcohol dehydrogenase family)
MLEAEMSTMNRVDDKVVVVAGGSVGIRRTIRKTLANEGAKVAVTDIQDEAGQDVEETIQHDGGTASFWHLGVADESAVQNTFANVREQLGPITVLVNNAGTTGADKPTHEQTEEKWD